MDSTEIAKLWPSGRDPATPSRYAQTSQPTKEQRQGGGQGYHFCIGHREDPITARRINEIL